MAPSNMGPRRGSSWFLGPNANYMSVGELQKKMIIDLSWWGSIDFPNIKSAASMYTMLENRPTRKPKNEWAFIENVLFIDDISSYLWNLAS